MAHAQPNTEPHPHPNPHPIPFADPWEYELRFPGDPRGPAIVRATLKAVLAAHGLHDLADRGELLVSELATNAVRHARGYAAVHLRWTRPVLRVSVTDASPELPSRPAAAGCPDAEGGRGLLILDLLADDWG
ncbi:ATP-binding protein, partial [Streptomyces sp. GC420]|uniref:ATP-binding protein n=1 Tax=Streptomyces sp. GC420 TaxID=2697568 RepID=UPI001414D7F7